MKNDLICFSHLRWNFVFQRPQHLMSRVTKKARVFYFEEPVYTHFPDKVKIVVDHHTNVIVVTPELEDLQILNVKENNLTLEYRLERLLKQLIELYDIKDYVAWYYAPMAISFTGNLTPILIVYDCMDELSAFKFAPPELVNFEKILFRKAGVVFTGGNRLFEAKKILHHNIRA